MLFSPHEFIYFISNHMCDFSYKSVRLPKIEMKMSYVLPLAQNTMHKNNSLD